MDDLISRQAALDALHEEWDEVLVYDDSGSAIADICESVLDSLPSAEPERKKGKWVGDCCSCCGISKYNYIKMVDDECGPFGTWNFCPNCGADMRSQNT